MAGGPTDTVCQSSTVTERPSPRASKSMLSRWRSAWISVFSRVCSAPATIDELRTKPIEDFGRGRAVAGRRTSRGKRRPAPRTAPVAPCGSLPCTPEIRLPERGLPTTERGTAPADRSRAARRRSSNPPAHHPAGRRSDPRARGRRVAAHRLPPSSTAWRERHWSLAVEPMLSYTALVVLAHQRRIALLARPPAGDGFARCHRQLHDQRRRELAGCLLVAELDAADEAGEAVLLAHPRPLARRSRAPRSARRRRSRRPSATPASLPLVSLGSGWLTRGVPFRM